MAIVLENIKWVDAILCPIPADKKRRFFCFFVGLHDTYTALVNGDSYHLTNKKWIVKKYIEVPFDTQNVRPYLCLISLKKL